MSSSPAGRTETPSKRRSRLSTPRSARRQQPTEAGVPTTFSLPRAVKLTAASASRRSFCSSASTSASFFLITSAAVLGLQQLSETADRVESYRLLRRLGAKEKAVRRALFTQIALSVCLPLALALVHSAVGSRLCAARLRWICRSIFCPEQLRRPGFSSDLRRLSAGHLFCRAGDHPAETQRLESDDGAGCLSFGRGTERRAGLSFLRCMV